MFLPILISTTLFLTPVWTSRTFDFSWGSAGENYEYVFEVYTDRELTNLYMALPPTTNTYVNPVYHDTGLFFQRIKYYPISSPNDFSYSYLGQFYLNLEKGIVSEDIPYFPPEEEEEEEEEEENQIEEEIDPLPLPQEEAEEELIEEEQEVLGISHFNYSLPSLVDYREVIPPLVPKTDTKINVANRSTVCKISLLRNEEETSVKSWDCNIETFKFLNSKKGKEWFEDVISDYIFPTTAVYEGDKAELIAMWLLEKDEIFNYNKAVEIAKKLRIDDLQEYIKDEFEIPPHIWIEGDMNKGELKEAINSSLFNKRFNK